MNWATRSPMVMVVTFGVGPDAVGHDGGVDYADVVHAVDAAVLVDDGHGGCGSADSKLRCRSSSYRRNACHPNPERYNRWGQGNTKQ